jgi:hypothetical protein
MTLLNNVGGMLKVCLLGVAAIVTSCQQSSPVATSYMHDVNYVNMMVDLTIANKVYSKTHYSNRDLVMDTLLIQLEEIHGKSMEDFDSYLRQVASNPKVYEEFLDSVNEARKRLQLRLDTTQSLQFEE